MVSTSGRRLLVVLGVVVVIVLVAQYAAEVVVDGDFVTERLDGALGDGYRVHADEADPDLLGAALVLGGVSVEPRNGGSGPRGVAERLELDGIDLWTLLVHGGLDVAYLRLDRPLVVFPDESDRTGPGEPGAGDRGAESPRERLAEAVSGLPRLAAERIRVEDAAVQFGSGPQASRLAGVRLDAGGLEVSAKSAWSPDRVLLCRWIELETPLLHWRRNGYGYELGPLRASSRDSLLHAERAALAPAERDSAIAPTERLQDQGQRALLQPLRLDGVDWHGLLDGPRLRVRRLAVDTLYLEVFADRSEPRPGGPPQYPPMPNERLQRLPVTLTVDSVRLAHGSIRYTERPSTGGKPGTILFADTEAVVTGLSNDSSRVSAADPAVFDLHTQLADTARLAVVVRWDLMQREVTLDARGMLSAMPVTSFNPILVNTTNIRLSKGRLDTLAFDLQLRGVQATGEMRAGFSDVEADLLDESGEQGLGQEIESFVANLAVLRDESGEDGSLLTVPIEYTRQPEDRFFKFLWAGLRSGLRNLLDI
ncbi:MAG: DUF748 domain-containing protein [Candidatus Krumholzibacteriia bacterium]